MKIKGADIDTFTTNRKVKFEDNSIRKIGKNIVWALKTPLGARPNLPEFGSKLPWMLFDLMDERFFDLARIFIIECVSKCEPRAILKSIVDVSTSTDKRNRALKIQISYEVKEVVGAGTVVVNYRL